MADTSVLERELTFEKSIADAQREHDERIAKNYQRLMGEVGHSSVVATPSYVQQEERVSYTQPSIPSAKQRIADYVPLSVGMKKIQRMGDMPGYACQNVVDYSTVEESAPKGEVAAPVRKHLFEGLSYRDGQLFDEAATVIAPTATIVEPIQAPEVEQYVATEEDSMPTRETMATISHSMETQDIVHVGFFAALSTKMKLALAAVATAIFVMIIAVCVNTAILNSMSNDLQTRQNSVTQLAQQADELQNEINGIKNPQNVAEWAASQGMTK